MLDVALELYEGELASMARSGLYVGRAFGLRAAQGSLRRMIRELAVSQASRTLPASWCREDMELAAAACEHRASGLRARAALIERCRRRSGADAERAERMMDDADRLGSCATSLRAMAAHRACRPMQAVQASAGADAPPPAPAAGASSEQT